MSGNVNDNRDGDDVGDASSEASDVAFADTDCFDMAFADFDMDLEEVAVVERADFARQLR